MLFNLKNADERASCLWLSYKADLGGVKMQVWGHY